MYPTETDLEKIKTWDIADIDGLLDYIQPLFEGYGRLTRKKRTFEMATGGWSGNEEIISALQQNVIFWSVCWMESKRGGWFKFSMPTKE